MKLSFTKMQGCGNDYIVLGLFDKSGQALEFTESLAVSLTNRNYSIGGDGLVLILPSETADAKMRMFNVNGSESKMCGNAIRCVAKYLYDNNIVKKTYMSIETLSGCKNIEIKDTSTVKVDMGQAILNPQDIPVKIEGTSVISKSIIIDNEEYNITCVSMGNPHAVIFCEDVSKINLNHIGPLIEKNELFPEDTNVEFVQLVGDSLLKMRVWERGCGETLACGTGACAAVVAAVLNGHCAKNEDITVQLTGGELFINYTDETVTMTGSCEKSFEGTVEI